jgi:membrane-anchored protein YejM (alkaline phosphatase superfamily)
VDIFAFEMDRAALLAAGALCAIVFLIVLLMLVAPIVQWRADRRLEERRKIWRTLERARDEWKQ